MSDFDTGIPNIRVVVREQDDEILAVDIPSITVKVQDGPDYNVNISPSTKTIIRTASFFNVADIALTAISSSYATTASYAINAGSGGFPFSGSAVITGSLLVSQSGLIVTGSVSITDNLTVEGIISAEKLLVSSSIIYESGSTKFGDSSEDTHQFTGSVLVQGPISASSITGSMYFETVTENNAFQIPLVSASKLSIDTGPHLRFNPVTHDLVISGGVDVSAGVVLLSPRGISITSGSNVGFAATNHYGAYTRHDGRVIGIAANASSSTPRIANTNNPVIFITSGSTLTSAYAPIEFEGSGSYTDGRVTINTPLVAKQGVMVTGSVIAAEFTGSLYGTASVADGIDVIFAGIYETGSGGFIIPTPSGGFSFVTSASYALTASYALNASGGSGSQGPQGPAGPIGPQGNQGPAGSNGASGPQGNQGPAGSSGPQGNQGPAGSTGSQGNQGPAGSSGPQGNQGPAGSNGASGPQGNQGPTGNQGFQGRQGPTGDQGFQGRQGPQGNQGPTGTGTQGNQGPTGPQGNQGPSGLASLPSGVVSSSAQISAFGYATTGSNTFIGTETISGSLLTNADTLIFTGSIFTSGSISVVGGTITGSLFGTASAATSASYALTASYAMNGGGGPADWNTLLNIPAGIVSSSAQAITWTVATASIATSASYALTASYIDGGFY
jgi:hypothetical protein